MHRPQVPRRRRIIVRRPGNLPGKFLEGLALRLGDQQRGEGTAEHEQREDLHDVVEPGGGGGSGGRAALAEGAEDALGDDGADFAGCGADAVGGGAVAGGEAFAGDDEGGCVGACNE